MYIIATNSPFMELLMPKVMLTPSFVKSEKCPAGVGHVYFYDQGCKGLVFEVRSSGKATYSFRYTDSRGIKRQPKLADANDITLSQARALVLEKRTQIALGNDPTEVKSILKTILTLNEFIHQKYLPFIRTYKKSWKCDEGLLRTHIEPVLGNLYLDQITKGHIVELFSNLTTKLAPGSCNRILVMTRYLFNLAIKWETAGIKTNPTSGFPLIPDHNKRERYLTHEEAQRLYQELTKSRNPMLKFVVPMLILTGARKREVLDAKWEDIDFLRNSWRIHTTKTGGARHIPLSEGAITLLKSIPRRPNSEWVFGNPNTGKPFTNIFSSWDTARKNAGLKEVRIHDLRHSFASFVVNAGRSLYDVQHLLGHTQVKTTQRYAHLSQDTLLAAANAGTVGLKGMFASSGSSANNTALLA